LFLFSPIFGNENLFAEKYKYPLVEVNDEQTPIFGGPWPLYIDGQRIESYDECAIGIDDFLVPVLEAFVVKLSPDERDDKSEGAFLSGNYEAKPLYLENDINGQPSIIVAPGGRFDPTPLGVVGKFQDPGSPGMKGNILAEPKKITPYEIVLDNCFDKRYDPKSDYTIPLAFFVYPNVNDFKPFDMTKFKLYAENQAGKLKPIDEDKVKAIFAVSNAAANTIQDISDARGFQAVAAITEGIHEIYQISKGKIDNAKRANWIKIFQDPPNLDFKDIVKLNLTLIKSDDLTFDKTVNSIINLTNLGKKEIVITDAILQSLEQLQGAEISGSSDWSITHALELHDFILLLSDLYLEYKDELLSHITTLENDPRFLSENLQPLRLFLDRISNSGFNQTEIRDLKNSGLNDKEIEQIRSNISLIDISDNTLNDYLEVHNNLIPFYENQVLENEILINDIDNYINETIRQDDLVNFDMLPIANSGGPYFGKEGMPLTLSGQLSQSNNSNIVSYHWDLDGDGFFDDKEGETISVVYNNSLNSFVGLNVTNLDGISAIDYSSIRIDKLNDLPRIIEHFPESQFVTMKYDSSQLFHITVVDTENDPLKIEWFIDDILVSGENGNELILSPSANDIGFHSINVKISERDRPTETIIYNWKVWVFAQDSDNDGWNANIDCDENDPEINPGINEIYNNGIDDDCNPSTPDFNASPVIINNNNIFLVEPNNSTDLPLSANDLNGDPLTFNILRAPMHGSIGDIIPFNSTLSFVHYIADAGFIGNDSLIFNVNDGKVNSTNVGDIKIRVGSDNSPPVSFSQQLFMRGSVPIVTDRNLPIHLESFDQENDPLTFEILDSPQQGTLSGTFPNLIYTPNRPVTSDHDSFTFRANDGEFNGNIAKILITFTQNIPNPQSILLHHIADVPLPVGIAHHPLFNKLVVSVNEPTGLPNNLEIINEDGSHNKYTNSSGLTDELKLASVRDTLGGFEVGEIFTGNGKPGEIIRISPDGSSVQDPWVVLPGETGIFRGGLHVDETGIYNGDLIAVTTVGNVWRINSNGEPTFLARAQSPIGGPVGPIHLEGVTTVPDIPEKYGPWAGKIVAGAEDLNGFFYIDTEGNISFISLAINGIGLAPEDIDIIPPNENFYGVDIGSNQVLGAPAATFNEMVGDFLVTQERGANPPLYHVKWNPITNQFVSKVIYSGSASWEHVTFSPANIDNLDSRSSIIADAGPDQTVYENQTNIILNGIASNDPDGDRIITSYLWEQIQGPPVELKNNNKSASSFTAPTVTEDTTLRFKLTVTNNEGLASFDVVDILVKNAKLIIADAGPDQTVNERSLVTLNGSSINPDGGNTISYKWSQIGGNNTVVLNNSNIANPTFIAPVVGENGDIIRLVLETVNDQGFSDTDDINIIVNDFNSIPVANSQNITIVENTPINITLTGTDVDQTDNMTFISSSYPSNGILSKFNSTTGQIQYNPFNSFSGRDIFTFQVFDGKQVSSPANITIIVTEDGINDPPHVEPERITVNVNQSITVDVLQNDIDPNGDLLTLTNTTGPVNGRAFLNQNQTITYQSNQDFNGTDLLYYRVSDQFGAFDIGAIIFDVQGDIVKQVIQVPSDRLVTTTKNQPINIELVATATIDRPVAFFIIDSTSNGTLGDITNLSNLTSSISYTPNNDFVGSDSFTYASIDANGIVSNVGTIRISVNEITGNPPVARDSQVMLEEDTSIPIQLDVSDSDVNDDLTYSIESQPVFGNIVSFDSSTGSLVYEPNANVNGNDAFLFKAVDQGGLESNIATVRIIVTSVNDPPLANNQQLETNQNTSLQITLSGSDHIDNDAISQFKIVNNPTNGQISNFNQMTGELTYTPNNNFIGGESFTFKVIDSQGLESTAAALISINIKALPPPANNPPVAVDKTVETNNNTPINIKLEGTDTDQGDAINTFTIISNPSNGQIINFNSNTGTLTYIPNNNFAGQDSFTFKVTDSHGLGSTNNGLVTINVKSLPPPVNNPPVAINKAVETNSNTPVSVKLEGRDADQGDSISGFVMVSSPTNGQISNFDSTTGTLLYTPNNNFVGHDTFTFKTIDSHGLESANIGLISINVKSLPPSENNPPVAFDKILSTNSNTPVNITLEASDNDTGDMIKSFNLISNPLHGQISNFNSETGKLTYIPNNNFAGQDSFTFKVTDSHGLESINTALVTINVNSAIEKKIEISSLAKCDPGESATGGGFALGGNATIKSSKPLATGDGWNVTALVFGTTGTLGDFLGSVTANVICFDNLPLHP
jgi:hypothetical protein